MLDRSAHLIYLSYRSYLDAPSQSLSCLSDTAALLQACLLQKFAVDVLLGVWRVYVFVFKNL